MAEAQELCAGADLLLCVGSSLEVYPVAGAAGADPRRRRPARDRHPGPDAVRRRGGGEARRRRGRRARGGARGALGDTRSDVAEERRVGPRATDRSPKRGLSVDKRQISTSVATRVVNPLVRWAVRHDLAPSSYAILETIGRRSGLPRRTPVGHVVEDGTVWIVAEHGHRAAYVRNIRSNPRVRIKLRDGWRSGPPRPRRGRSAGAPAADGTAVQRARRTPEQHRSAQRPHRSRSARHARRGGL